MQERVTTVTYGEDHRQFNYTIVLNLIQAMTASLISYVYIRAVQRKPMLTMNAHRWKRFFQVAVLNSSASPFGYMALRYINYPTMTLAKTCKMVPVLLMNKVLYRRHYPTYKYAVVAMVTAGVSAFMLFKTSSKNSKISTVEAVENSLYGLLLVLINLTIDGAVNSTQDQVFAEDPEITGQHMMCMMNVCSTMLMTVWLLNPLNPELFSALQFLHTHPRALVDIGMFAVCGSLGQCFVFYTLAKFGSLTLTTVTVTRKFLTILISVFYNGHALNSRQWSATGVVFAGITLDVYKKQTSKKTDLATTAQPILLQMTTSTDLQSLLRRIEKATTRLEELATKRSESASTSSLVAASSNRTAADSGADSKVVLEYEAAVQPQVAKLISCSSKIGGVVSEQAQLVETLFNAQRNFIRIATLTKKPTMSQLPALLGPQQSVIQQIIALRDANRPSEYFDNLSTIADGIAAFGWVAVEPTPVPYINDMKDSAQFYSNRVLKKWREKDGNQVDWVKAFLSVLRELSAYVKQFHTTGLVWNPHGEEAEKMIKAISSETAAAEPTCAAPVGGSSASGLAPPPPPPPPPVYTAPSDNKIQADSGPSARGALFSDLNKGGDITSGLRKVEQSQMTHKNPSLRAAGSTVKDVPHDAFASATTTTRQPQPTQRLPRLELQGSKWVVENYGTEHLTIEGSETKQTVYMYNCKGTTLEIRGKLNGVAIDNCQKCGVVFDTLVALCEIVNCKSVQVQVRETVPAIQIDRTDGAQVFLSEAARDNTQITTAKASEVNISYPYETLNPEDDNFVEQPIPEQFQTVVRDGKLVTTVLEHSS
ncbi:suppressor of rasval19 [Coemansia thaxteri]|nr:suppressor of rasval19 [Coemansia thaxteri]